MIMLALRKKGGRQAHAWQHAGGAHTPKHTQHSHTLSLSVCLFLCACRRCPTQGCGVAVVRGGGGGRRSSSRRSRRPFLFGVCVECGGGGHDVSADAGVCVSVELKTAGARRRRGDDEAGDTQQTHHRRAAKAAAAAKRRVALFVVVVVVVVVERDACVC